MTVSKLQGAREDKYQVYIYIQAYNPQIIYDSSHPIIEPHHLKCWVTPRFLILNLYIKLLTNFSSSLGNLTPFLAHLALHLLLCWS